MFERILVHRQSLAFEQTDGYEYISTSELKEIILEIASKILSQKECHNLKCARNHQLGFCCTVLYLALLIPSIFDAFSWASADLPWTIKIVPLVLVLIYALVVGLMIYATLQITIFQDKSRLRKVIELCTSNEPYRVSYTIVQPNDITDRIEWDTDGIIGVTNTSLGGSVVRVTLWNGRNVRNNVRFQFRIRAES